MAQNPTRPLRLCFFHIMQNNFSGAQKNIYRLLRRIDQEKIEPILCGQAEAELTRRVREDGMEVIIIPYPSALEVYDLGILKPKILLKSFGLLGGVWRYNAALITLFRARQPDVVWCDNIRTFFTMYLACKVARTSVILNIWSEPSGKVAWLLNRIALFLADRVNLEYSGQGQKVFGSLANTRVLKKKIVPLYTGVSDFDQPAGTDVRKELGLAAEDVILVMASGILPGKGQLDLLEAMAVLVGEFAHLHLLIAGAPVESHGESMKYQQTIDEFVSSHQLEANVHLLGWRSDVTDILQASDVYVSSSYTESLPDAVRDGMSVGKPVVATDVGGTAELVLVGENGYLFQPGDIVSLIGYLRELVCAPALRRQMGLRSKRIIEEHFSTEAYARKFESMVLSTVFPKSAS